MVTLNFEVAVIMKEYERLQTLAIGEMSTLYYVNIFKPYWYFTILDSDGNELEITGERIEEN